MEMNSVEMKAHIEGNIEELLGFEIAKSINDVALGKIHILCLGKNILATCHADDETYVNALLSEICTSNPSYKYDIVPRGFKAKRDAGTRRPAAGKGFGNNLFRLNHEKNSVEISFGGKPSPEVRNKLKERGFRWSHTEGVWYLSFKRYDAEKHGGLVEFCVVELKLGNAPAVGEAKK